MHLDGQTEVMNRVLEEILRCSIDYKQTGWYDLLPGSITAMNDSFNVDHNMSANEVFFGRKLLRPLDLMFGSPPENETVIDYLNEVQLKRSRALDGVRRAIVKFTLQYNKCVLKPIIDPRLSVGKLVLVKNKNLATKGHHQRKGRKLAVKNPGPFKIIKLIGRTGFQIDMPGYKVHPHFHADDLIPYDDGKKDFVCRDLESKPDHVTDGENFYVVDKIDGFKKYYRKPFYYVIYKGYDVADGEWMSRHVLMEDCPELVLEYDEAHCSIVDGKERWAQEGLIKTNTPEYFKNKVDDLLKKNQLSHSPLGHVVDREAVREVEADPEAEPGPEHLTKQNVDLLDSQ